MRHRFACGPMLLAALLVGLAASCSLSGGRATPTPAAIEVVDQLGRTVRLAQPPQRIVSLSPGNTEILFALGLGDRVVGVTDFCDYPAEALERPKVGGFASADIERIVALAPDLMIAASIHAKKVVPELERRNLTTLALAPKTLDELFAAIALVGRVAGADAAATALVQSLSARVERVRGLTADVASRPRVLALIWHDPPMVAGGDTWQDALIAIAGGENVFHDLAGYPSVDLEAILRRDPQVIIANSGHGDAQSLPFPWASTEPRLRESDARRTGRVYEIDSDLVDLPGPRLVDGLERLLALIQPELATKL